MEFHEFFFEVRRKVKHEEEERRYFSVVKNKEDEGAGKWRAERIIGVICTASSAGRGPSRKVTSTVWNVTYRGGKFQGAREPVDKLAFG